MFLLRIPIVTGVRQGASTGYCSSRVDRIQPVSTGWSQPISTTFCLFPTTDWCRWGKIQVPVKPQACPTHFDRPDLPLSSSHFSQFFPAIHHHWIITNALTNKLWKDKFRLISVQGMDALKKLIIIVIVIFVIPLIIRVIKKRSIITMKISTLLLSHFRPSLCFSAFLILIFPEA